MPIELPPLPYPPGALQPHLSAQAVSLLHDQQRHWLERVNQWTADTEWSDAPLEQIVLESQGALHEAASQAWALAFQWRCLRARGGGEPQGALAERINRQFGDAARLRETFNDAAAGLFGSGWAWLVRHPDGHLAVQVTRNAGTPLTSGSTPLLACCLWEHAYYTDYQNDRRRWLDAWWHLVDWESAGSPVR